MSDFRTAFLWLMENEDAGHRYATVPDAPPGAHAISGINSAAFPTQFAHIAALPQAERGDAIEQFYEETFWNHWFEAISSDEVAMRVFDTAVNLGVEKATLLLQQAVNALNGLQIVADGKFGPNTIEAVNNANPAMLVASFQALRYEHYAEHDANSPALKVLLARAEK